MRFGQGVCRQMVITHNGVDASFRTRFEGIEILGATIQGNQQGAAETLARSTPLGDTPYPSP